MEIKISDIANRTFGWIQNPSDFSKLKKLVQVFDHTSEVHADLKANIIPKIVDKDDGRDRFINILNKIPLKIKYADLVGTSFIPRSKGRCNGIAQAIIKGQGKPFTDNWTADGYVRWAYALGFIEYDYLEDAFYISRSGFDLSRTAENSDDEKKVLIEAMLTYPPAVRVLDLLSDGGHLTKFDIGKHLGFNGEPGFTSLPLEIIISSLSTAHESEKNKIRQDWEGSSDKYARMIAGWLSKLGLVKKEDKTFKVGDVSQVERISHAYKITGEGLRQLRRAKGTASGARRITKHVCWEMFATKKLDRDYIRSRRAYILKSLDKTNGMITPEQIRDRLKEMGFNEDVGTIRDDIRGLINIGLNIEESTRGYALRDTINDFVIPVIKVTEVVRSDIEETKAMLRENLKVLPHEYIELVEIAQNPDQNRVFEMKVIELFIKEYGFNGSHLGGSRRPDGAVFTDTFGVIVDTKAYKDGYNLPISQADEMERYVRENKERNEVANPNKWWSIFPETVKEYMFLFVSSFFKGNFRNHLERISLNTGVRGGVISVEHLLLGADYIKRGVLTLDDFRNKFNNDEIEF